MQMAEKVPDLQAPFAAMTGIVRFSRLDDECQGYCGMKV